MSEHYLKPLFDPSSIILVGASQREGSPGKLMLNSLSTYNKALYLVNPKYKLIDDNPCYRSISKVPEVVDLAIIVTPGNSLLQIIAELGRKGVGHALVLTRGIGRVARDGRPSKNEVLAAAKKAGVRILGPRAGGLIRPSCMLNATMSLNEVHKGKVALVSKSSTLCSAMLDWAEHKNIGFSSVVPYGMELDLDIADILDFLADDYQTRSIILHLDEVANSRRFMSAIRAAATRKPVVVMKSAHDAGSYSDAIARTTDVRSMDDVFHAAISRAGLVRVYTFSNLFSAARTLSSNLRLQGSRLGIISNGRAPMMMATDRMRHLGKEAAKLSPELIEELNKHLHVTWSKENPIVLTDGCDTPKHFAEAAKILLASKEVDALVIIFAPDPRTNVEEMAEAVINEVKGKRKPVLTVLMGDASINVGREMFNDAAIANFRTPESAIDAFSFLCTYLKNQNLLLQIPYPLSKNIPPDIESARQVISANIMQNNVVLTQTDSRKILEAFNIECAKARRVTSPSEAAGVAEQIGYPVVLKIDSPNVTYKSDINGVRLNVSNEATLRSEYEDMMRCAHEMRPDAYIRGVIVDQMYAPRNGRELMIRIINDPAFGPVISFGMGGTRSPAMRDRAIQLPPLNRFLAKDLVDKTRVSMLLDKFRNMPAANRELLSDVLLRVSEIACELPQVFELTINPLVLDESRAVVTDVQVVIQKESLKGRRYDHLAVHPYPSDWVRTVVLKNHRQVEVRPVRPEDAQAEAEFVHNMSSQAKYFRFMHAVNDLTPEMLSQFTKIDYDREMSFVAMAFENDREVMIGVSQYVINPDKKSCEFAVAISDDWQGLGLARKLMLILMEHIKERDLEVVEGTVLRNNTSMDHLMSSLGFIKSPSPEDHEINIYRLDVNLKAE